MNFFSKIGASIKEFFRKKVVYLKRNPKIIPLLILLFGFVYYSLNLTAISETTLQIQLRIDGVSQNMGLTAFAVMLLSILCVVCLMNAFPRRKKVNIPMLVVGVVMIGVVIFCDIHYTNCIWYWWNHTDRRFDYVEKAYNAFYTHMYITIAGVAALALMPVYTRLLKLVNTSVEVEDNGKMDAIELSED